ncbi:MAG: CDP-alcohol phosphatidyltransferase family protein [Burkholderiales bacterium]
MSTAALIVGASPCHLWGLDAHERLRRQLREVGVRAIATDPADLGDARLVLVVDAGFLFGLLTLRGVLAHPDALLVQPDDGRVAAASVARERVDAVLACVRDGAARPPDLRVLTPLDLAGYDRNLRKTAPPLLEAVTPDKRAALEALLYGNAYKGVTDFVTKWWWPRPARVLVGWCARFGITPNSVTLLGVLLMLAATYAFYRGAYAVGLACGWVMTLLDTVDGKLARVTVASSRLGHFLDHGVDIVHPPFWYVAWGLGLGSLEGMDPLLWALGWGVGLGTAPAEISVATLCWLVAGGYLAGRLIEVAFHQLGHCGIFAWRPFDAWFRLIVARRNPCLVILTLGTVAGRPDVAFVGVVVWTLASSAILFLRLVYATGVRWRSGEPLDSWLKDGTIAAREHARAWRTFSVTRGAYR